MLRCDGAMRLRSDTRHHAIMRCWGSKSLPALFMKPQRMFFCPPSNPTPCPIPCQSSLDSGVPPFLSSMDITMSAISSSTAVPCRFFSFPVCVCSFCIIALKNSSVGDIDGIRVHPLLKYQQEPNSSAPFLSFIIIRIRAPKAAIVRLLIEKRHDCISKVEPVRPECPKSTIIRFRALKRRHASDPNTSIESTMGSRRRLYH